MKSGTKSKKKNQDGMKTERDANRQVKEKKDDGRVRQREGKWRGGVTEEEITSVLVQRG